MERRSFFKILGGLVAAPLVAKETFIPPDVTEPFEPIFHLHPAQREFFYGGAAGGGKSLLASEFDEVMKKVFTEEKLKSLFECDSTFYDAL